MMAARFRVYVESSVFGGAFDEEFMVPSRMFFEQIRAGCFQLVVSPTIEDELTQGPEEPLALFEEMLERAEQVEHLEEAAELQQAYLEARVVGKARIVDALHVAMATVSGCRAIVSWNFKHIVHMDKIPLHNGVNMARGYPLSASTRLWR